MSLSLCYCLPQTSFLCIENTLARLHARIQRGEQGLWTTTDPPPPQKKNHKNIRFLSNTGPPLINHKATKQVFNFGPLLARQRRPTYSGFCLDCLSPLKKTKKKKKKPCQSWTPSDKNFWISAWTRCKLEKLSTAQ